MNHNISGDNSTHSANIRLATPFDRVFRCFQLGRENITEESSIRGYPAENFETFINQLGNIFKTSNEDLSSNTNNLGEKEEVIPVASSKAHEHKP